MGTRSKTPIPAQCHARVFLESESKYFKKKVDSMTFLSERVEAIGSAKWTINPMLVVVTSNAPKGYLRALNPHAFRPGSVKLIYCNRAWKAIETIVHALFFFYTPHLTRANATTLVITF
uniref:Uncharacterized protein n=1 Tax=Moorena producens (strain JHB) TaxID=1454205 RepID=A0A1D9G0F2_MOOP1